MQKSFYQQAEDLKREAVNVILFKCKSLKSGRKVFRNLEDVGYCMDEGGYSCERVGCVTEDGEVFMVTEEAKFNNNYDFDDDPNTFVVGQYGLDSLTYSGLFTIADAILKNGSFESRFEEIRSQAEAVIKSIEHEVRIAPIDITLDINCNWFTTKATRVASAYFVDERNTSFKYDDVDGYDTTICDDELILLADAVVAAG